MPDATAETPMRFRGRIVDAEVLRSEVPLRKPLQGRDRVVRARSVRVLRLRSDDGTCGLGEASAVTWLSAERTDRTDSQLDTLVRSICTGKPLAEDLAASSFVQASASAVRSSLATALVDIEARRSGLSVARLLGACADRCRLPVSALLAAAAPVAMASEASRLAARGFDCFKIKIGADDLELDVRRVSAVRAAIGPLASIRLDANGAWGVGEAAHALDRLAGSRPELVEEPLRDAACVAELERSSLVALDESIVKIRDLERAIGRGGFRVLVLKLERVGGPLAAIAMAAVAERAGIDVVVTDSIEGPVGRAAALHVAAAVADRSGKAASAIGLGGLFFLDDGDAATAAADVRGPGLGVDVA
ncbi:MAG TPA: mandelate racemase/muconate lactonizing enzyme family protein [Candidatus Limnocylindrales bacterium]|nr:mandelate racemase/muconate lactonizing enzyme family protein [Candidatus Limnocylindrales bacterium]